VHYKATLHRYTLPRPALQGNVAKTKQKGISVSSKLKVFYKTSAKWKKRERETFFPQLTAKMTLFLVIKHSAFNSQTKIDPGN